MSLNQIAAMLLFTTAALNVSAQKTYKQGIISITTTMGGQPVEAKEYFDSDSTAFVFTQGPATVKILNDAAYKGLAVLVTVPVASMKKAGIATEAQVQQTISEFPKLSFKTTAETKSISGYSCNKVIATDVRTGSKFDVWITHDVFLPAYVFPPYYAAIGGFPVLYVNIDKDGKTTLVTVTGISGDSAPHGMFAIPADYDKITMDQLNALSGGK